MHGQIAPFHDYIEKSLPTTTLATIYQRLHDERDLTVSVASLRRYVRSEFAELGAEEQATVLRDDPPPGAEAQLDYGHLGSWLDPASGGRRRVWGFIMVLSFSRHLFCYPVLRMTQGLSFSPRTWPPLTSSAVAPTAWCPTTSAAVS